MKIIIPEGTAPEIIKALQDMDIQIITLQTELTTERARAIALEAQLATAQEKIACLSDLLAVEKEGHLATMQINETLQAQIEQLELTPKQEVKVLAAEAAKIPTESFKVGDIDYVITVPAFHFGGKKITGDQLLADADLQALLVKEGAGFIKRKGDK